MTTPDYTVEQKWAWVRNAALALYGARLGIPPMMYVSNVDSSYPVSGSALSYRGEPPVVVGYTHQKAVQDALRLWQAAEEARTHE